MLRNWTILWLDGHTDTMQASGYDMEGEATLIFYTVAPEDANHIGVRTNKLIVNTRAIKFIRDDGFAREK